MSTEAVKKRGRPKRIVLKNDVAVVGTATVNDVPAKKTRSSKVSSSASKEVGLPETPMKANIKQNVATTKELGPTEMKRLATSKRPAAKNSGSATKAPLPSTSIPSQRWSTILEQAQAFSKFSRVLSNEVSELLEPQQISHATKVAERPLGRPLELNTDASIIEPSPIDDDHSRQALSSPSQDYAAPVAPTMPKSAFLNSFLNDPEPAPAPPPASARRLDGYSTDEPTEPQFNADMISAPGSPQARRQQQQQQQQRPATSLPSGHSVIESIPQLRAYTTTSFKKLRASNASRPMFAVSSFKALKADTKPASTSAKASIANTTAPSTPQTVSSQHDPKAISSFSKRSRPPPMISPPRRSPPSTTPLPSPTSHLPPKAARTPGATLGLATLPAAPPPSRPLRPTEMPYEQLIKSPEYHSKRWKWTRLIVALPLAIFLPYELYRRYQIAADKRIAEARRLTEW